MPKEDKKKKTSFLCIFHSFPLCVASAVSAIKLGVDVERTSRGISDRLVKLTKLSDEELTEETQKLLDMALESGEIIDVAEVPEDKEEDEIEDA